MGSSGVPPVRVSGWMLRMLLRKMRPLSWSGGRGASLRLVAELPLELLKLPCRCLSSELLLERERAGVAGPPPPTSLQQGRMRSKRYTWNSRS